MKTRMWVLSAVATLVLAASNASAFTVRGSVKNGTTGAPVDLKVIVIRPSMGMQEVGSTQTQNGRFEIPNLANDAPIYLLRGVYNGVNYNAQVPVTGQDQNVDLEVFESSPSWDGVEIVVPHLAVSRQGDALHVEQLYEITNDTTPPRTVAAEGGAFRMFLPADMDSLNDCFISAGEMPLKIMPIPTDKKDIYSIDFPIRPGVTRVSIAYSLPYASGGYTMNARFPLPVPHMMVFAVDSTIHVSSSHEFVSQQSVHGMSAYAIHNIGANSELTITFTGGDPNFGGVHVDGHGGDEMAGGDGSVGVAPDDAEKLSVFLMVMVLFVLGGIVAVSLRDPQDPLSDPRVLRAHYATLLTRLARLDDLHAANAIPSDAYRASREDLMGRLGALALLLRKHGGVHVEGQDTTPEPKTKVQ